MGYRLNLPASMKVHDVFHVCYLKPYRSDGRVQPPPVPELIDDEPEFEVQEIVDHRHTKRGHQRKLEYLLRFTGYGAEHDMWQDDVSNCAELVQEYWDRQTVTQRLHAAVCVAYKGKRSN